MADGSLEAFSHVLVELDVKEAARACGATELGNTRQLWETLWNNGTLEV